MNDQDFAIVVGINAYAQLTPLRGAMQDANRFKNWLLAPEGGNLPETNVRLIISPAGTISDPFDATPVKRDIDRALRDFGLGAIDFTDPPTDIIGRRLYFYFAGHGVSPTFDDVAMLMADAGPNMLNNNVGMRPYRNLLQRLALFGEYVFIMDCCRDLMPGILPAEPAFTVPASFTFGPGNPVNGFVIMAAAWGRKANERPMSVNERPMTEDEERGRMGVLTTLLTTALNDPLAADALGQITSRTLQRYLTDRMPTDQKPAFSPPDRDIFFTTIPTSQLPTVRVRIKTPAGLTGQLVLRDGSLNEIGRQSADQLSGSQPPWTLDLERNRLYGLEHLVNGQASNLMETLDLRNVTSPHEFTFGNTH